MQTVPRSDLPSAPALSPARPAVAAARRIVVKIGTRVLTEADGTPARSRLTRLLAAIAGLWAGGREVVLVTSGAVGVGRSVLGHPSPTLRPGPREACAAVGQSLLASLYQRTLAQHGLSCGQLLVGQRDLADRARAVRLMRTLDLLLRARAVPLLNENDAVEAAEPLTSVHGPESVFADNDRLAALIAGALGAELLVLLTDVAGVFDGDPRSEPTARLLSQVVDPARLPHLGGASAAGRGGMRSKVEAALIASRGGCGAVIATGHDPGAFSHLLAGERVGTWFPASGRLAARERWIAFAAAPRGILHLDEGAARALLDGRASLLEAGVARVEGRFRSGEVVELHAPDGARIGRALSALDDAETRRRVEDSRGASAPRRGTLIRHANIVLEPLAPRSER